MKLIDTFYKGIRFLLCINDILCKYAWLIPLKDKKGITIIKILITSKNLKQSNRILKNI